jgi:hypothetical protein
MKPKSMSALISQIALLIPLFCFIGYVVGSWGAKEELEAYKKSVKEGVSQSGKKANGFDTFAGIVKIPETTRRPRKVKKTAKKTVASTNAVAKAKSGEAANANAKTAPAPAEESNSPRRSVQDLGVRIEEAQELWRTRVEVVRAQWKDKLKLSGEMEKAFDSALRNMNERLYDSVQVVADLIAESESMSPELGLRLVGETTAIMAETYDKIAECVPGEMRSQVSSIQIVDFVDPGVADPLISVQGKLEDFGQQMGRRR